MPFTSNPGNQAFDPHIDSPDCQCNGCYLDMLNRPENLSRTAELQTAREDYMAFRRRTEPSINYDLGAVMAPGATIPDSVSAIPNAPCRCASCVEAERNHEFNARIASDEEVEAALSAIGPSPTSPTSAREAMMRGQMRPRQYNYSDPEEFSLAQAARRMPGQPTGNVASGLVGAYVGGGGSGGSGGVGGGGGSVGAYSPGASLSSFKAKEEKVEQLVFSTKKRKVGSLWGS